MGAMVIEAAHCPAHVWFGCGGCLVGWVGEDLDCAGWMRLGSAEVSMVHPSVER